MNWMVLALTTFAWILFANESAHAFPENTRLGYASCSSCHVSPTGGGILTKYGRQASEEFMGTWSNKGENELLNGKVATPDWFLAGGDFRILAFARDNGVFHDKRAFPMQADGQFAAKFDFGLTAAASLGLYDRAIQSQNHFIMGNFGDNFFARVGRFFPAFGIYTAEHSVATRKGLGFNQGRESYNAEFGFISESGEIIFDAILQSGQIEISDEEKGFSTKAAWYAGGNSQLGVSYFSGKGTVWDRNIVGLFAITGLTKSTWVQAEIDHETKTPIENSDFSEKKFARLVTYEKLGWEMVRGLTLLGTYEATLPLIGSFDSKQWAAGPGVQWFIRPHMEVLTQAQIKYDETWSKKKGNLLSLMLHYYL